MAQPFLGTLNHNQIFGAIYNMILNQRVFADNIAETGSELVDRARVEPGMYGDKILYYATDILGSDEWGDDAEAAKLLELHRPLAPDVEEIEINQFRQISLTLDDYMSKRAFSDEGTFAAFTAVLSNWINSTKRVFEAKTYNTFIGTHTADGVKQNITVALPSADDAESQARLEAQSIAKAMANLFVDLADASRDYNDLGNYRSVGKESMIPVWNAAYVNEITKMDLPTIFHTDGMFDPFKYVLPAKYFGTVKTESGSIPGSTTNLTVRSLVEKDYNTVKRDNPAYIKSLHIFPGDLIPAGYGWEAGEAYDEDSTIICKVMHESSVPFASAFEVGTSFFNSKSLTENRYLTFGYNTLTHLGNYPFITMKAAQA